ncbi:DUF1415 domain-containing protein [Noviherbaspirillum massiliense]|uniref:DUF1415 domain-containing protein n=1 Tax=Noviherbaspirillum massiliense TaxID=1465823 RepID=UPI00068557BF|nr:DUF1415 domain-containing protein [Noviherbaspirillum massiliense]
MTPALPPDEPSKANAHPSHDPDEVIVTTRAWLEKAVIGLNLCPFAKAVHVKQQVRYVVSNAQTPEALREDLVRELETLAQANAKDIDTTLLIHPSVLLDFLDYNDFLDIADETLSELGLEGQLQVASFHPRYQFAGTAQDDIENYTNRSPYPILHLLREDSIERAVESFPDASEIYEKNIATMRRLGHEGWRRLNISSVETSSEEPGMKKK